MYGVRGKDGGRVNGKGKGERGNGEVRDASPKLLKLSRVTGGPQPLLIAEYGVQEYSCGRRANSRRGRLVPAEREVMEGDLRLALNAFQRKNYANDFRRGWRWAYRTGLDGGKVTRNWSQDAARRYGLEAGLSARERRAEELKGEKAEG